MGVANIIFERITHDGVEYCALPEYSGCFGCAFEHDTLKGCQATIGYPISEGSMKSYCHKTNNPHGVSIVWIKPEEIPNYLTAAVIHRMTQPD